MASIRKVRICARYSFSKALRHELSDEKKAEIYKIIDELAE